MKRPGGARYLYPSTPDNMIDLIRFYQYLPQGDFA
jgi:hypothetical protein